jgi:cystathionine gamma-synthase
MTSFVSKASSAVRAAIESDTQHGAVVPPLHLSSNYTFDGYGTRLRMRLRTLKAVPAPS